MALKDFTRRLSLLGELWLFARTRKRLWLFPALFVLVLLSFFVLFVETSVFAPFIYSLF